LIWVVEAEDIGFSLEGIAESRFTVTGFSVEGGTIPNAGKPFLGEIGAGATKRTIYFS